MRLDLRKLRFRQPKLVATHLCLLFGSRESRHYARANTFMGPDPKYGWSIHSAASGNPSAASTASIIKGSLARSSIDAILLSSVRIATGSSAAQKREMSASG